MKYKLHIAYANREDLAKEAVESVLDIGNIHLWPNGENPVGLGFPSHVAEEHWLPPLPATSVINLMIQESWHDDVMFWAHSDMFCPPGIASKFLDRAKEKFKEGGRWGALFSNYDALCCFNMQMLHDVGYWDTFFHQYVADKDFYRRMRLKGWDEEHYLREEVEHHISVTIKADPLLNRRVQFGIDFCRNYYSMKWGGHEGQESFTTPFEDFRP